MRGKTLKIIAICVVINLLAEIFYPTAAWALGGGPSQPEVQSFEPSGTSDMVDLFSGDFNYNIPLFDVEGYPINIAYHSGISMDQEATWVGLGWNINPGAIIRSVRGMPDEFNGDTISKSYKLKENTDFGLTTSIGLELLGLDNLGVSLNLSLGINYNNYKGIGYQFSISPGISAGSENMGINANLGLSAGTQSGAGFNPNIGVYYSKENKDTKATGTVGIGASYNTRGGLKSLTLSTSMNVSKTAKTESSNNDPKKNGSSKKNDRQQKREEKRLERAKDNASKAGPKKQWADIASMEHSNTLSFASPSYLPTISMPMKNTIVTLSGTIGSEAWALHPNFGLSGYKMTQSLRQNSVQAPAYGYLYAENGRNSDDNMKDFNREKDLPYSEDIPNLPITNFTYDIYSISGQGTGGMFRPYRNDVGIVCDRLGSNLSTSFYLGLEIGLGNVFRLGANLSYTYSYTNSGMWDKQNELKDQLYFIGRNDLSTQSSKPLYEPYYLKISGEKQMIDDTFYDKLSGEEPIRIHLDKRMGIRNGKPGKIVVADNSYESADNNETTPIDSNIHRSKRELRTQVVSYLTNKEASKLGKDYVKYYQINQYDYQEGVLQPSGILNKAFGYRKKHHIAEYTVTNPDGKRYVYGLPAYNTLQEEVTFSVSESDIVNKSTGLVSYNHTVDNSLANTKGQDNYFNKVNTPPYAHSYLLTEIQSTDYVDVTGDGISDDDLGTAIKFNYSKAIDQYNWRVPYDEANFEEGFKSDALDNKASYIYGEKEIWYLHSVESNNYILEFYMSERLDGVSVLGKEGSKGYDQLYKIDSISLYSKQDRLNNGSSSIPIKTAHFKYDYTLCNNIPNKLYDPLNPTEKGKLTLKRLWFTYGKSNKARLNGYQFCYDNLNPDYNLKGYDRWGNYKQNNIYFPNSENPYVDQNKSIADQYSSSWTLSKIILPSGGTINIDYESDDYAYVQDKQAMKMFKILNIAGSSTYSAPSPDTLASLFDGNLNSLDYIFFQLDHPITDMINAKNIIKRDYLKDIDFLYFKCLAYLQPGNKGEEYVPGYAELEDWGLATGSNNIGFIKLKKVGLKDKDNNPEVNPIAKTAWQYLRLNLSQKIFGDELKSDGSVSINSLAGFWKNIKVMFKGFNKMLRQDLYGKSIRLGKSWIRLNVPDMIKFGGGVRVKKIYINDEWAQMGKDQPNVNYGQTYDYTKEITLSDGTKKIISSGVASYEPMLGGDENVLRQPIAYKKENLMAPDDFNYIEKPIGEIFYPNPDVGYSRIKVRNITPAWVKKHATGYVVSEFYTAKDFPTKIKQRNKDEVRFKPKTLSLASLFGFDTYDFMFATQGYTVELNDMHGKMKAQYVYQENNETPISSMKYEYFTDNSDTTSLSNKITMIDRNNHVFQKYAGKEKDIVIDMRSQESTTYDASLGINLDAFLIGVFPFPIPTVWPKFKIENTGFKSVVVTKIVQKYGILKKTVATDLGAKVTTENVAFDAETGDPILTKVNNEFNDTIFNFQYPAYWIYDGMGLASKNIGAIFEDVVFRDGRIDALYEPFFSPGDELLIYSSDENVPFSNTIWAYKNNNNELVFIDRDGELVYKNQSSINMNCKIIRSGRRNMLNLRAGEIATMSNPIVNNSISLNTKILNASSSEFSDHWQNYYSPILKKCDSLNLFACNLEKLLKYLFDSNHKLITKHDQEIHKDSISCNNQIVNGLVQSYGELIYNYINSKSNLNTIYAQIIGEKEFDLTLTGIDVGEASSLFNLRLKNGDINHHTYEFLIDAIIGGDTFTLNGRTTFAFINKCYCDDYEILSVGDTINPYIYGIRGNWRKKKDYVYITERDQTDVNNNSDIRVDGTYHSFNPFWQYNSTNKIWEKNTSDTNWVWNSEVSLYDPHGMEMENRDPLNRYSAQLLGFNYSMTSALASNSKHNNLLFESFEDYNYKPGKILCSDRSKSNLNLNEGDNHLVKNQHHSGWYSYMLTNDSLIYLRDIIDTTNSPKFPNSEVYVVNAEDFIYGFTPDPQKYVVSCWVKEESSNVFNYTSSIKINLFNNSSLISVNNFTPTGNIIDGWQRIYGVFTLPQGTDQIRIALITADTAYFDDIRIHPFTSNMKSWVYDERTLKLMAELDENNYAAFYEYDIEGQLIRIKKETERGIMTIQESRNSMNKH